MPESVVGFLLLHFGFTVQYICALLPFCLKFGKRSLFPLRVAVSAAVMLGAGYLWSYDVQEIAILVILRYAVLYALGLCAMTVCFRVSLWTAVFCSTCAYAVQHLAYRLASPVLYAGTEASVAGGIALLSAYVAVFAAVYTASYFIIGRRAGESDELFARSPVTILISATVLLCVIVFSAIYDSSARVASAAAEFSVYAFDCMCCVFILGMMNTILHDRRGRYEFEYYKMLWEKEKRQYELSRETVDLINIKCHDMKKYIETMKAGKGIVTDEDIANLTSLLEFYDRSVKTGNEVVDVLLAERAVRCEKAGIKLSCMIDGGKLAFMRHADVYSLFANILDNAIEASENVSDPSRRTISVTASVSMGMLFIHAENIYEGRVDVDAAGVLHTTKADKAFHGFGLKSIRRVAQTYGGESVVHAGEEVFSVDITLPLPKSDKTDGS